MRLLAPYPPLQSLLINIWPLWSLWSLWSCDLVILWSSGRFDQAFHPQRERGPAGDAPDTRECVFNPDRHGRILTCQESAATYTMGLKKSFVEVVSTECSSRSNFVLFSYAWFVISSTRFPSHVPQWNILLWNMKARVDRISNWHARGIPWWSSSHW